MNVEHLLRTAVDDAVREVPPGFADGAIRRGRRSRRLARVTAGGGAALVVAAAAVGVAVVGADDPSTGVDPAGTGGVVDLGTLAAGAAPEVPWYADGALHFGSASTPYDVTWDDEADQPVIQRVIGGYVVWTWTSDPDDAYGYSRLALVPDDGEQVVLADGHVTPPVVSADGGRIAWGLPNRDWDTDEQAREDGLTSVVVVADASGEVVAELPDAPSPGAQPMGFLADGRVVLDAAANEAWGTYAWAPGGEVTLLREDLGVRATSPDGLAVLSGTTGPEQVTDLATGAALWQLGSGYHHRFSPDGRYLVTVETWDSVERPDDVVIRDARTGAELTRITFRRAETVRWESPTAVVIEAYDDPGATLVRCTTDGSCELSTEIRPADPDPDAFDSPYVLG
ncbi:hypothetical protein [Jiangella muralis]|uniref:hypothetical protein n=1 Tax=Jiangella muralis TaxID=702383 RepID=UPI00069E3958|nr:hypothetical protein [Jiangella muralis]